RSRLGSAGRIVGWAHRSRIGGHRPPVLTPRSFQVKLVRRTEVPRHGVLMKRALITGITGQDGSYLAEFLLEKGYEVHGLKRRASSLNTERVDHLYEDPHAPSSRFFLHYADLTDSGSLTALLYDIRPDEVYNLGAQSHVKVSFEIP